MGIERVTPQPAFYASEPEVWEIPALEAEADKLWKDRAKDRFYLLLPIAMKRKLSSVRLTTLGRRQVAQIIACTTGKRAVFNKQTNCYQVGGWNVGDWVTSTPLFSMKGCQAVLPVLDALAQAGYELDDSIELYWTPPEEDCFSALAISDLTDRESEFLRQLLQLKADLRFTVEEDTFAFDIALNSLSSEALNRALLVIRRIILYGTEARRTAEKKALETSA